MKKLLVFILLFFISCSKNSSSSFSENVALKITDAQLLYYSGKLVKGQPELKFYFCVIPTVEIPGYYDAIKVNSFGVEGLTMLTGEGFLQQGDSVAFYVQGTPNNHGKAFFAFYLGGLYDTVSIPILAEQLEVSNLYKPFLSSADEIKYDVLATTPTCFDVFYETSQSLYVDAISVNSTGITGLTATMPVTFLEVTSGSVEFCITGETSVFGQANFEIPWSDGLLNIPVTVFSSISSIKKIENKIYKGNLIQYNPVIPDSVSVQLIYSGGNGGFYPADTVTSFGVFGLTAILVPGKLNTGEGAITYYISGTPIADGTAYFPIVLGGVLDTLEFAVSANPVGLLPSIDAVSSTSCYGVLTELVPSNGSVTAVLSYVGGNGRFYSGSSFPSFGVSGLTATLSSGVLALGSGDVMYHISGIPNGYGDAVFPIFFAGQSAVLQCSVNKIAPSVSSITKRNKGHLTEKVFAKNVSTDILYTGGNGASYHSQEVFSLGVKGLTAFLSSGSLVVGTGIDTSIATYYISGTPQSSGKAFFPIVFANKIDTLVFEVQKLDPEVGSISFSNTPTLIEKSLYTDILVDLIYTLGNGADYPFQLINSIDVLGLTAVLSSGTLNTDVGGYVTYRVFGTPESFGYARFPIVFGGKSDTLIFEVQKLIPSVQSFSYNSIGELIEKTPTVDAAIEISYIGGNGADYSSESIVSLDVVGLTANLTAGTLNNGSGNVIYNIVGTPLSFGYARFPIVFGGKLDTLVFEVKKLDPEVGSISFANTPTLIEKNLYTDVLVNLTYTGGNSADYPSDTVFSEDVLGLKAVLSSGILNMGSGNVIYHVSGIPESPGYARFPITFSGKTAILEFKVDTLYPNVSSISLQNFGELTERVRAQNISVKLSYFGGNGANYYAQSIPSLDIEGLTVTLAAGVLNKGDGFVTYNISGKALNEGLVRFPIIFAGIKDTIQFTVKKLDPVVSFISSKIYIGELTEKVRAQNVSVDVFYDGGNGGAYPFQSISSLDISGLTAVLSSGDLATGSGKVTYNIFGTASNFGPTRFPIVFGGIQDTLVFVVKQLDPLVTGLTKNNSVKLTEKVSANNALVEFSYTGGNGADYPRQIISSTGVLGLTAVLSQGILNEGDGNITYHIVGTPMSSGYARFPILFGGVSYNLEIFVDPQPDFTNEQYTYDPLVVGVQEPVPVVIVNYTNGNGADYEASSVSSTGVTGLTAKLSSGTLLNGSGYFLLSIEGKPMQSGQAFFTNLPIGLNKIISFSVVIDPALVTRLDSNGVSASLNQLLFSGLTFSQMQDSTFVLKYEGGNGGIYDAMTFQSSGVTGLQAYLPAGQLSVGTGTLTFTLRGTFTHSGQATFNINAFGTSQAVNFNINYGVKVLATNIGSSAQDIVLDNYINPTKLYIAISADNEIKMLNLSNNVLISFAGSNLADDIDGSYSIAAFNGPWGITYNQNTASFYITDRYNCKIRKLYNGNVTTVAGLGSTFCESNDVSGTLADPRRLAYENNNLYFVSNDFIKGESYLRKIDLSSGKITTFYTDYTYSEYKGIVYDAPRNIIYISTDDRIVKYNISTATMSTYSGSSSGFLDGALSMSKFSTPSAMGLDENGNVYVADKSNRKIRKITPTDVSSIVAYTYNTTTKLPTVAVFPSIVSVKVAKTSPDNNLVFYILEELTKTIKLVY